MRTTIFSTTRLFLITLFCLALHGTAARAQSGGQGQQQQPAQTDEVIRVNTELVQTDVTVLDKQGRFVEGLKAEQFELRVGGKPQPISFFDRVTVGSAKEEQLARRNGANSSAAVVGASSSRGRTIIFIIDDLHLSLQSVDRTRQTILHFIDHEMGFHDLVAIASASGQIGFLQQFTNNKTVLRAAVARLMHHPYVVTGYGTGSTVMTENMALSITGTQDNSNSRGVSDKLFDFFVQECMRQTPVIPKKLEARERAMLRTTCETQVKSTARAIVLQSAEITRNTYYSLETLMQSAKRLPGRKLAFFISDGFILDAGPYGTSLLNKLEQVIDSALRAGVVVYTIDAKGLVAQLPDATNSVPNDPSGRIESALMREIPATQDALMALADDTGGRALRNRNVFDPFVSEALNETSNYYVLAWRPETEEQKAAKFRKIEVSIAGHPELTVRLARGYMTGTPAAVADNSKTPKAEKAPKREEVKTPETEIRAALTDFYIQDSLPTLLSTSYLNTPNNGLVLTASMQVASGALAYGPDGKQPGEVDVAGVILNDKGKIANSFKNHLTVKPVSQASSQVDMSGIIYNYRAPLAPGIYQVRVAARDAKSGRVGSAMRWIVIPDLSARQLALSSLLVGGQVLEANHGKETAAQPAPQVQFSVDQRFPRSSHLGFWIFIYNAARTAGGTGAPDLTAQVQVFRDGVAVVNTPQRKLTTEGMTDLARIPYGGQFALNSLAPGRYELRITITDRVANTTASESIGFEVN